MTKTSFGLHHLHRRKRNSQLEPYPHPNKLKRVFDDIMYFVGLVFPLLTLPQVVLVWSTKNVAGLSLVTWITYFIGSVLWLCYGILHKEKVLIINSALMSVLNFSIVLAIVMY